MRFALSSAVRRGRFADKSIGPAAVPLDVVAGAVLFAAFGVAVVDAARGEVPLTAGVRFDDSFCSARCESAGESSSSFSHLPPA